MQNRPPLPRLSRVTLLAALCIFTLRAPAQNQSQQSSAQSSAQSTEATIEHLTGIVLSSLDGRPVPRVLVVSGGDRMAAMTDSDGRFSFDFRRVATGDALQPAHIFSTFPPDPPPPATAQTTIPVQFILRKPGYVDDVTILHVPIVEPDPPGPPFVLHIHPAGLITGHLYGESGRDLPPNTRVEILRHQPALGMPAWSPAGRVSLNSRGEFRIPNLLPGDYKLLAPGILPSEIATPGEVADENSDAAPEAQPKPRPQPDSRTGYIPSYYANADSFASAATLHVGPGETVAANLTLRSAPFYRINIPTTGLPPQSGFSVHIEPESPGLSLSPSGGQVTGYLPNGNYDILLITQGPQNFQPVRLRNPPGVQLMMPAVQPIPPAQLYAAVTLRVQGHAIQTDPVAFHPAMQVAVNILRELSAPPTAGSAHGSTGVFVTLESLLPSVPGSMRPPGPPGDNLTMPNVMPGLFHVAVSPEFAAYVASLTSGGTDLLREPLRVLPGVQPPPVQITLRDDFASLSATIVPPPGTPPGTLPGGSAVAVCIPLDRPQDRPQATSAAQPQVIFSNLAPGRYLLLAYTTDQAGAIPWQGQDSDAIRDLIPKGTTVTLTAGQQSHAEAPLLPEPPQ